MCRVAYRDIVVRSDPAIAGRAREEAYASLRAAMAMADGGRRVGEVVGLRYMGPHVCGRVEGSVEGGDTLARMFLVISCGCAAIFLLFCMMRYHVLAKRNNRRYAMVQGR